MMQPRIAAVWTLGVAVATVTSALALDGASGGPQAAPPQVKTVITEEARPAPPAAKAPPGGMTKVTTQVKVFKAAPAPKAGAVVKKPAAPDPAAKAMMKMAVPLGANNDEGQVQQYMQQFRPILRAEYHIVRVVCRPTPEQRKGIARDAEQTLREAARKYVDMMRRPMTATQRAASEPRKQIREGLAKAVKARLPGEIAERYRQEIAKREASRKQLAVRNLVARLDRDLVLSPDQRDKIAESLGSHWDDSWCQSIEMFMYDYQFLPPIPDQYVAPFLNDPQKAIWRGIQKVYGFWGGFGMMGGIMVDDPLEDEELRAARLEAAKGDPNPAPNGPMAPMMIQAVTVEVAPVAAPTPKAATKTATKPARAATKEQKTTTNTAKEKAVPKQ